MIVSPQHWKNEDTQLQIGTSLQKTKRRLLPLKFPAGVMALEDSRRWEVAARAPELQHTNWSGAEGRKETVFGSWINVKV